MKEWLVDVPVLLEFFCREKTFSQVFEQVKIARPRVLLLYQDGPREGREDDITGIKKCREIAETIDWDCEVYKNYQEKNVGCDPSGYNAQRWAFSIVDKCIVLEDDVVPSQSFFRYCKELLDYYEHDERINFICGMNHEDVSDSVKESYYFSTMGSIWGWASWRRVIDTWDPTYSVLDDSEALKRLRENSDNKSDYEILVKNVRRHKESGRAHFESIGGLSGRLNNRLNIVPKYNMVSNVGVDAVTTHGANDIRKFPKRTQKLMFKTAYEMEFPLIHPKYVLRNKEAEGRLPNKFEKFLLKCESIIRRIIYR